MDGNARVVIHVIANRAPNKNDGACKHEPRANRTSKYTINAIPPK